MQPAPTPLLEAAAQHTRAPKVSWSSWRLLPLRLWAPLLAVLLMTLAMALAGEEALDGGWTRLVLLVMSALTLALLATLTRLFLLQAERQASTVASPLTSSVNSSVNSSLAFNEREMERRIASRTQQLSALATRQLELSEAEKADLARKLHDELGGLLTAAKMDASWLQARVEEPRLRERLLQQAAVLDEAMSVKRRVVEELRPSLLDHFGLATALSAYVEAACAEAGLAREMTLPADCALPRDTALALFRVSQEALSNTIRHAGAHKVRLKLKLEDGECELELADDGCGFDPAGSSLGILGMRHRISALGGQLDLSSTPGQGTTLRVRVPAAGG